MTILSLRFILRLLSPDRELYSAMFSPSSGQHFVRHVHFFNLEPSVQMLRIADFSSSEQTSLVSDGVKR